MLKQNFTTYQENASESYQSKMNSDALEYDVAVVGAGIGGLAASILLRQAGFRVICIEPKPFPHSSVGESLDMSAPALLRELGLSLDELVDEQAATYKRALSVFSFGEALFAIKICSCFSNWPLGFETLTCHVDRAKLDQKLFDIAQKMGVMFVWERVSRVETEQDRVMACQTTSGQRIAASWFIDASGRARLFSKTFSIEKSEYGRQKVCLWTHFDRESQGESTTFHVDNSEQYLSWIWEIAITPAKVSVGYIIPADELRERRKNRQSVREIFAEALIKHERFAPLLAEQPDYQVSTCSYHCHVNQYACGANWFIVGEAASMPDPLTSNGVTAALRHAQAATRFIKIQKASDARRLSTRQQQLYNQDVLQLGHALNRSIETALYDWPIRQQLGFAYAVAIYSTLGYFANALYSKFEPRSWPAMLLFKGFLTQIYLWILGVSLIARLICHSRQLWGGLVDRQSRMTSDSTLKKYQK